MVSSLISNHKSVVQVIQNLSKMEEDMNLNKREEEEEADRISDLPDPLIHHILSFLTIKHVAQTSVLSKKWSYIWITNPILDFQEPWCFQPTDLKINEFMDFIDGTLQRRYSGENIQRFTITWYKHLNVNRVNSWITWAVRHNVQQLSLYLIQNEPLNITRSLFTCESLISLKLQISPDVRLPNYISFPKLKSLEIEGVEFSNEYWNEKLFSNCPVLEDFRMEHCTWFGMPNFCISTPALKHLKINNWDDKWLPRGEDDGLRGCTLKVHAPNLETLFYNGSIAEEYVLTTFPLLVRAAVQFRFKPYVATRKQRISHGAAISQFLRALANIKRLFVSDDTLQALSFADDLLQKLPTFHNTKELIMFEEVTAHNTLVALLKATPNLKLLIFNKTVLSDDEEEEDDAANGENNHDSDDDVAGSDADAVEGEDNHDNEDDDWTHDMVIGPECLFPHLKAVYFNEFVGNPMEMEWVKLILMNAKALRTISISNYSHSYLLNTKRKEELMVEIPSLPRASTTCMVKFPSW